MYRNDREFSIYGPIGRNTWNAGATWRKPSRMQRPARRSIPDWVYGVMSAAAILAVPAFVYFFPHGLTFL